MRERDLETKRTLERIPKFKQRGEMMIEHYERQQPSKEEFFLDEENSGREECKHNFVMCYVLQKNGSKAVKQICLTCGSQQGSFKISTFSSEQLQSFHPITTQGISDIATCYYEKRKTQREEKHQKEHNAFTRAWWEWYHHYLQSPVWKRKHDSVLSRAGGMCEACGYEHATQVHHLTYTNVGKEPLFDLVAVCEECHDVLHPDK